MEIGPDGLCQLTTLEERYTGLPNPVHVSEIDGADLLDSLDSERQGIEARQAADDDDLTHAERAAIVPDIARLRVKTEVIGALVGQVTAWQIENQQAS